MQLTQSLWLFYSLVNLQSAKVFQSLISLSAPDEMIYLLSGEKEHVKISFLCPTNLLVVLPDLKSQSLMVLSHEEEIKKLLSFDKERSDTKLLCPVNYLKGYPINSPLGSWYKLQIMIVLSLDPETKTSESSPSF